MKRSPLRRQGPRGRARAAAMRNLRADWKLLRGGVCEARWKWPHVCAGPIDGHHIRQRSLGGGDTRSNVVFICRYAHDWVHANPVESVELGLLDETVKS